MSEICDPRCVLSTKAVEKATTVPCRTSKPLVTGMHGLINASACNLDTYKFN